MELVGYLYPSQGKLAVRTLASAVRPLATGRFEKYMDEYYMAHNWEDKYMDDPNAYV
jgi:hypothetical protein